MRIIIIDESKRGLQIMRRFIARKIPDVEVTEYVPDQQGKPGSTFDWSTYDVLLISYELTGGETGLEWYQQLKGERAFPPTILVTATTDTEVATKALKLGVSSVFSKRDLTPDSLSKAVEEARDQGAGADGAPGDDRNKADAEIVAEAGQGIGYRFGRLIGQGGMSRVYLAERLSDGVTVVIKIMDGTLSRDSEAVQRFVQESELASKIDSPYVVQIFEQGFTERYGFMAMEFFSRGDLKHRLEQGITNEEALLYALNIAYGLQAIHGVGIVHRDLKPANIMFRGDDSMAVADFGISKAVDATNDLTVAGSVVGTPSYMSPEQVQSGPTDTRSDLYSLGIMLYEMLAGRKPYEGDSMGAMFYAHMRAQFPPMPRGTRRYEFIVRRLMAKEPDDRQQTAAELIAELEPLCASL